MDVQKYYNNSSYNISKIQRSVKCYCFYCFKTFSPNDIKKWVDNNSTAICPFCKIDAVLGDYSLEITDDVLQVLHKFYFSNEEMNVAEIEGL